MSIRFALAFKIFTLRHDWESGLYQPNGWFGFWPWLVGLDTNFPDIYSEWSQNFPLSLYSHLIISSPRSVSTWLNRDLQGMGIGLVCFSHILYEPKAIGDPANLRRRLIFKSKFNGDTLSNMENPETINHNAWIRYCLLWNMQENKDPLL